MLSKEPISEAIMGRSSSNTHLVVLQYSVLLCGLRFALLTFQVAFRVSPKIPNPSTPENTPGRFANDVAPVSRMSSGPAACVESSTNLVAC